MPTSSRYRGLHLTALRAGRLDTIMAFSRRRINLCRHIFTANNVSYVKYDAYRFHWLRTSTLAWRHACTLQAQSRSRGTSMGNLPTSPLRVLRRLSLRATPAALTAGSCLLCPRCVVIPASSAFSTSSLVRCLSRSLLPLRSSGFC